MNIQIKLGFRRRFSIRYNYVGSTYFLYDFMMFSPIKRLNDVESYGDERHIHN